MMSEKKTKTSIKYLPLEIWALVLAMIPSKILLRFKSICKSWRSIIDDPDFVHLHLQLCNMNNNTKNNQKGCLMTVRRADTFRITDHNLMSSGNDDSRGIFNGLSVNGLILTWEFVDKKQELRLWNLSIRKSLLVPSCPIPSFLHNRTAFVFGFAPSTKEHKIIAITFDETSGTQPIGMFFAVYTLSDQRWIVRNAVLNVESSCFKRIFWLFFYPSNTVYFQGAVHCIANDLYKDNKNHLISLDFDSEKFSFMELPYFDEKRYTSRFLFILGESLAVFIISEVNASIWVLELDDGKKVWTLWFSKPSSDDGFYLFKDHKYSKAFYYESDEGGCLIIGKNSYNLASGWFRNVENLCGNMYN